MKLEEGRLHLGNYFMLCRGCYPSVVESWMAGRVVTRGCKKGGRSDRTMELRDVGEG